MGLVYEYEFLGMDGYMDHIEEIKAILQKALQTEDMGYYMAINEAVCNAARYALAGPEIALITVRIRVDPKGIKTTVKSITKEVDMMYYREKLRKYAANKDFKGKDWQDVWEGKDAGRGFWLMLSSCDYIFVDRYGQYIELHTPRPYSEADSPFQIEKIVSRFFIDDQGMIL